MGLCAAWMRPRGMREFATVLGGTRILTQIGQIGITSHRFRVGPRLLGEAGRQGEGLLPDTGLKL